MVGHIHIGGGHSFRHGGDVQDIAEDSGLAAEQLEVGVHRLAKGVLLPVVRVAQLLHGLRTGTPVLAGEVALWTGAVPMKKGMPEAATAGVLTLVPFWET